MAEPQPKVETPHPEGSLLDQWQILGRAYGDLCRELVAEAEAFAQGVREAFEHPADRAQREWQEYLASLPCWERWAVKVWRTLT